MVVGWMGEWVGGWVSNSPFPSPTRGGGAFVGLCVFAKNLGAWVPEIAPPPPLGG